MKLDLLLLPLEKNLPLKLSALKALERLEIHSTMDLLLYKPISYSRRILSPNLSKLKHSEEILTRVKINEVLTPSKPSSPMKVHCSNESGSITLVFFKRNPFINNLLKVGNYINCAGKVEFYEYYPQISHPEIIFDKLLHTDFDPKYGLTYGITNNMLRNFIGKIIQLASNIPEWMPIEILRDHRLPSFQAALKELHQGGEETFLANAIKRLKFDEALANQIGFKMLRTQNQKLKPESFSKNLELQQKIMKKFGHNLTQSQKEALSSIEQDQASSNQMIRMIQGDVGCGKTIVALLASCNVIKSDRQVVFLVPTEVLAFQHYSFISKMLDSSGINVAILTSKTSAKERSTIFNQISTGETHFIIGTHALLNEELIFKNLSFIVIDEQHKFGVKQRMMIASKGNNPDILLMSATPIPRSLSMAYFGDLAISKITEMPSNRKKIQTLVTSLSKIDDIIRSIHNKIASGQKIYWVCPLIENKVEELENTTDNNYKIIDILQRYEHLSGIFGDKVAYLHGGMKLEQKNNIIDSFRNGTSPLLISTTVVEVGIDVPDATLMIIENAERFGLAQLHQLRGRVGRGAIESCCILLKGSYTSAIARMRLSIMKESSDGFFIAEKDLTLRGEGEFFGEKQSGGQNFRFLDLATDADIIEEVSKSIEHLKIDESAEFVVRVFNRLNPHKNFIL